MTPAAERPVFSRYWGAHVRRLRVKRTGPERSRRVKRISGGAQRRPLHPLYFASAQAVASVANSPGSPHAAPNEQPHVR
jgi:hypothetical protein